MTTTHKTRMHLSFWYCINILFFTVCFFVLTEQARAEAVRFKVVEYISKLEIIPIEDIEGHMVGMYQRKGLALFENDMVATVTSSAIFDGIKGKGTFQGYSTLTYEDGSTTVYKYQGRMWREQEGKLRLEEASGELIKGTGRFERISGTLSWTGKRFTPHTKEEGADNLLDVTATYNDLPSK